MRNILSIVTAMLLIFTFTCTHAEVYSWVDKEGKKHFGEKVPKEYANQSTELKVKSVNTMDAAKVTSQPDNNNVQRQQPRRFTPPANQDSDDSTLSGCEQQKLAYQKSVQCYSRCQGNNNDRYSNHVNNVAACSNCVDVKKPNCD